MRCEEEVSQAIDKYGDMIRRICFIHLKKETDVDDIFQNVFIKYATKDIAYASAEHEKAWFIRVSINECQSMLRGWFHQKVDLRDDLSKYGLAEPAHHPEVLQAILKLRDTYRNVVYLYYYEGYKITEIAKILNRSENTIHTWMKRAKEQLKEMLGGDPLA
ncbi:MAG: sigma-70 family RNA polymerase sigma factor [Erysipelotrichaceae bacterium]|uniref:Sigma-70 family RNA polymerase sigma factor n=1 Tax=Copranaerobaculum intestinale TaxID=2692629 RepID=A0A6N8U7I4_9FIRM|nr:sigma-70 family RNA polymerase sigma factor [Copranaerobaculum intestinale]MBS6374223.1 sigma-70 family RNA polymerase sigma factor [Erysipelotrichaceae bacterium]MXQ72663.1 sigma-70 family RNA polymerase sigma factor [Copranaerobaculum intestinale]